ncbi:hypothetical protein [Acinetobacter johnsonii]|uniref:Cupin n=1 Tax=Acinetobacter johnsonii TaxID=40214 RepID=A0A380U7C6_ACIJO|nr:hypothetical protein [Acinetobacter johnsonii]ENU37898.1 hypothetical protein F986_03398 [Acinetobacter johnsonii CIP 64.6]MBP7541122.1 hypothetical protein [Saprospiraceae bacterium]QPS04081.1 hypothetical protein I6G67_00705 [Acinetobacter johnsonii]SUT97901.1 Uncharacterised protein [Acinetobacter johnsonii]
MTDIIPPENKELLAHILRGAEEEIAHVVNVQEKVAQLPQLDIPVFNYFAPNIYMRQMDAKAGTLMVTKMHKTEHFLIILKGSASVLDNGELVHFEAPQIIKTKVGTKRVIYFHDDSSWLTAHPTTETDLGVIEEQLIVPEHEINQFLKSIEVSV